jgi:hypothetical protein
VPPPKAKLRFERFATALPARAFLAERCDSRHPEPRPRDRAQPAAGLSRANRHSRTAWPISGLLLDANGLVPGRVSGLVQRLVSAVQNTLLILPIRHVEFLVRHQPSNVESKRVLVP